MKKKSSIIISNPDPKEKNIIDIGDGALEQISQIDLMMLKQAKTASVNIQRKMDGHEVDDDIIDFSLKILDRYHKRFNKLDKYNASVMIGGKEYFIPTDDKQWTIDDKDNLVHKPSMQKSAVKKKTNSGCAYNQDGLCIGSTSSDNYGLGDGSGSNAESS